MWALGPRMNRTVLAAGVVIGIAACNADLGGPEHARLAPAQVKRTSVEADSVISIVDHDGTQYTLSIPDREIRMSDGRILELTADQTSEAVEAFYATMASDPVAQDVNTIGTDYGSGLCKDPDACPPQQSLQASGATTYSSDCPNPRFSADVIPPVTRRTKACSRPGLRLPSPGFLIRRPISSAPAPRKTQRPPSRSRIRAYKQRAYNSPDAFSFAQYGGTSNDACTNVVNNAISTASTYFNRRTSFISEIWDMAIVETGNALKKLMPYGSSVAVKFEEKIAEHQYIVVNVNVLAFVWNSYNCSNRQVTAGPIFMQDSSGGGGGGGGGSGGGGFFCESEVWQISFDNGNTYHDVTVNVCFQT